MKRSVLQFVILIVTAMLVASPVSAYHGDVADAYAKQFAPVKGPKAGKYLGKMKPQQFVDGVKGGKEFITLDIRTPGEAKFFTGNLPGHLVIPLSKLFERNQLNRLPTDKPIVVICQTGVRAVAAVTALRYTGFENTYFLAGGFKGLSTYMGAPQANKPLKAKAK